MKKAPPRRSPHPAPAAGKHKTLLPLFAVGSSLAAAQANALELGDAVVQSRLGQPLRASIALALAPNERLSESCVSLSQGASPSGLPGVGRATITIVDGALLLRGSQPIREPLVSANIVINCPSTPNLSREYMMFIDPPGIENSTAPVAQVTAGAAIADPSGTSPSATAPEAAAEPNAAAPAAAQPARRTPRRSVSRPAASDPIGQATRYRVQPGDSLSEITQRIENRKMRLWDAVNVIFEANPDAFINNDPNMLKAGSWLTIPSFDGSRPIVTAAVEPAPAAMTDTIQSLSPNAAAVEASTESTGTQASSDLEALASPQATDTVVAEQAAADSTVDVSPAASAVTEPTDVAAVPIEPNIVIPDVELEGPQTASTSPNVTTATASSPEAATAAPASSWLLWLGGAGVAVILGLLLFGRALRERFELSSDADNAELPLRSSWQVPESSGIEVDERVDWGLNDEPTVETEALDADLVMGTGLESASDSTLGAEIGFPVPTEVDIELPFESDSSIDMLEADAVDAVDSGEYGTIDESDVATVEQPALEAIEETESAADPDEYEELDTKSIEVATIEETSLLPNSPVDPTIAFEILEQDYEDELSATMALNVELTQAAADLSSVMGASSDEEASNDDNATAAMSLASVTEIEFDGSFDGDAANSELELALDEPTVKMPAPDDEKTRMMARKHRSADGKKAG